MDNTDITPDPTTTTSSDPTTITSSSGPTSSSTSSSDPTSSSSYSSSDPTSSSSLPPSEIPGNPIEQNAYLRQLYSTLVNDKQEKVQVEVQKTAIIQSRSSKIMNANQILIIIFYVCCLIFAAVLFFFSKSPRITSLSVYQKIAILLVALTYPQWISIVDQLVMFVIRYLRALILGVQYTKYERQ